MKAYKSYSSGETETFGKKLAEGIFKSQFFRQGRTRLGRAIFKRKNALVFALVGDLGSGKTTFVQGFLRGLGLRKRSPSPTFIIMRRFKIENCKLKIENLYHIDAYRIKNPSEILALGFRDIISDPKNIVLVEWADRIKMALFRNAFWIKFSHGKNENERVIKSSSKLLCKPTQKSGRL